MTTEGLGVARSLASKHRYSIDANRELVAVGSANLLAGLFQGFVQAGGSSQPAAADDAGGRSQLTSIVAAGLILLTGAFWAPVFKNLPQATLGAIVVVAVIRFFRVDELRRFRSLRPTASMLSLVALVGVLTVGVLPGLIVAVALSLMLVVYRLSRPTVSELVRDRATGKWGRVDGHPDWERPSHVVAARVEGPLFYANSTAVKERLLAMTGSRQPRPSAVVLDLAESPGVDVETLDMFGELSEQLGAEGSELVLAQARAPVRELLRRSDLTGIRVEPTLDAAVSTSLAAVGISG